MCSKVRSSWFVGQCEGRLLESEGNTKDMKVHWAYGRDYTQALLLRPEYEGTADRSDSYYSSAWCTFPYLYCVSRGDSGNYKKARSCQGIVDKNSAFCGAV